MGTLNLYFECCNLFMIIIGFKRYLEIVSLAPKTLFPFFRLVSGYSLSDLVSSITFWQLHMLSIQLSQYVLPSLFLST